MFADTDHLRIRFAGSVLERGYPARAPRGRRPLDDPRRTANEDAILGEGIRNLLVAPLQYQDELLGTLELTSTNPGISGR